MKANFTFTCIILAGFLNLLVAQSGPLTVKLYTSDTSGLSAPGSSVMIFSFSNGGKDSIDVNDSELPDPTVAHEYCVPYTVSAENQLLGPHDGRNFFTAPKVLPFGLYANRTASLSITTESLGSVPDYNDSVWNEEVGNIYLKDLSTGVMHDIFEDTITFMVPIDTLPTPGFQLHFFPALYITTVTETCAGYADGSMHITNPGSTNWILLVSGPTGNFSAAMSQTDTLLNMLPPGTYSLAAFTNGVLSDSTSITIAGAPAIVPTFTPSTTSEGQGINITFTNTTANSYIWTWDMGDGNFYSTTNATHAYANAGTYLVTLTATDTTGCAGDASETIVINMLPPSAPPQFWNPGNPSNHNNSRTKRDAELSQREGNTLVITQHADAPVAEIKVYTVNGQLVVSQKPESAVTEIPLTQGGCYIVVMTMVNGEILSDKIVLGL